MGGGGVEKATSRHLGTGQNGRGGGRGGACEVLPLRKRGGGGEGFSDAQGVTQQVLGYILCSTLKFNHIEGGGGGAKSFHSLKGGA